MRRAKPQPIRNKMDLANPLRSGPGPGGRGIRPRFLRRGRRESCNSIEGRPARRSTCGKAAAPEAVFAGAIHPAPLPRVQLRGDRGTARQLDRRLERDRNTGTFRGTYAFTTSARFRLITASGVVFVGLFLLPARLDPGGASELCDAWIEAVGRSPCLPRGADRIEMSFENRRFIWTSDQSP